MTSAEIRAAVLAYYRIEEVLRQPLHPYRRGAFEELQFRIVGDCGVATQGSAPSRWARNIIGPVLAAGLGAAVFMREDVPNPGAALRLFGLSGEHSLSSHAAWKLVQPYSWEPVLSPKILEDVQRRTGLRLNRLPKDPAPADLLLELTRARAGGFPVQVAHWMADYFRDNAGPDRDDQYPSLYRSVLADLVVVNERGGMAQRTGPTQLHGRLSRDEWEELIHGRVPLSRLEVQASYQVVKQFLVDYWEQWNSKKIAIPAGIPAD